MKKGLSDITIVLDCSGSMSTIKKDVEGGFKSFLEKQKQQPGECRVSLTQFDTEIEQVYSGRDLKEISEITVQPRGGTALLDAIGKAVNETGARLAALAESERPETVIVLVITDGEENSSKEFTQAKVAEMVKHQTDKYNWKFVFLGANMDAVFTGTTYGASAGLSMTYAPTANGIANTFSVLGSGVSCLRSSAYASYTFSEAERAASLQS